MDTYRISNLNLEQEDINNLKRISTNMLDTFNHEQLLSIIDVMKNTYFMNELSTYLVDDNLPDVGTEEFNFLVLANKYKGNIIRKIVRDEGISDYYLRKFVLKYNLTEVDKGVYIFPHKKKDSLFIFQQKYSKAVISHETSLYLQDVIDYIPQKIQMSVPEKYNISRIQEPHENRLTSYNYVDINSNNIMDKNIPIKFVRNKSINIRGKHRFRFTANRYNNGSILQSKYTKSKPFINTKRFIYRQKYSKGNSIIKNKRFI